MNRQITMIAIMLAIMVTACSPKERAYPLEYPEEQMIRLMVDLYTAEALASKFKVARRDSVKQLYAQRVYDLHDVNKYQIDSMFAIINKDQYAVQALQKKVLDRLRHIEERMLPKLKKGQKQDSSDIETVNEQ